MNKTGFITSIVFGCLAFALPVTAIDLDLPSNARLTSDHLNDPDSYALPVGPFSGRAVLVNSVNGNILRQSWRIENDSQTTLQLLSPLRAQLENDGFEILFDCQSQTCGGFDFRFETEVIPAPDMHVDLFDFRFLSAFRLSDNRNDFVTLLVSRSSSAGFVQLIHVAPSGQKISRATANGTVASVVPTAVQFDASLPLLQALETTGHAVLSDLTFKTGSSQLGDGPFASLDTLSAYLLANPKRTVALVGHTDAVGSLSGNIALSKRRAASVVDRLIKSYSIPRAQLAGEGMGYLAPIAANTTQAGRDANRRVEVVLLNTQ